MTNEQMAKLLEAFNEQAVHTVAEGESLRAGASALREVERLREALGVAEDTFRHYGVYHAARGSKDKADKNHALADRMAAALAGTPTPDPRDARIAELEAALRDEQRGLYNILDLRGFKWHDEDRYGALTEDEIREAIARIDAALKEARDDAR